MKKQTATALLLVGALALRAADFENEYVTMAFDAARITYASDVVGSRVTFVKYYQVMPARTRGAMP